MIMIIIVIIIMIIVILIMITVIMIIIMQVRLEGPTRVQWSGVASVPIKVLIANSDWNKSVRVTFEALSSFSLPVLHPPPLSSFFP